MRESRRVIWTFLAAAMLIAGSFTGGQTALADTVTPGNPGGWWTHTGMNGDHVAFVPGPGGPPDGAGSLEIGTPNGGKAGAGNGAWINLPISDIWELSYWTYMQAGGPTGVAVPAIKLPVMYADGSTFTTLIFEPAYNGGPAAGTWQSWNAAMESSVWWSSKDLPNGICAFNCFVSWSEIKAAVPDAYISDAVLIETGSGTPGALGNVDSFSFNGAYFDFEPAIGPPTSRDDCKNGGWAMFNTPYPFKNQGDCNQYVNTGR